MGDTYRVCFEAITVNVPQTPADLRVVINGREFEIGDLSGLGLTARGFFACVDLPADGRRDIDVFISVDEDRDCTITERDFYDAPDCERARTTDGRKNHCLS